MNHLAEIDELKETVKNLAVDHSQIRDVIRQMGGLLPPPRHLQIRVVGISDSFFIQSGDTVTDNLDAMLGVAGKDVKSFESILDFGCGCGRVLRALHYRTDPRQKLYGADIDAEAIAWCQQNYGSVAEFSVNPVAPPTEYQDSTFDLVFSISVFTHLPEEMQFAWLGELHRIAKPGGYLILTFHGENHYHHIMENSRDVMREKGFCYLEQGTTEGLPEFYQSTFHSHDYIRSRWSEYFEIIDIKKLAIQNHQDAVLCRKPIPRARHA